MPVCLGTHGTLSRIQQTYKLSLGHFVTSSLIGWRYGGTTIWELGCAPLRILPLVDMLVTR